jgi:hypothetical protein
MERTDTRAHTAPADLRCRLCPWAHTDVSRVAGIQHAKTQHPGEPTTIVRTAEEYEGKRKLVMSQSAREETTLRRKQRKLEALEKVSGAPPGIGDPLLMHFLRACR